jgi:hypothetical protein
MEIYYTHMRGLRFFLEVTGNSFEGRYEHKISGVGEQAIKSMAVAGKVSWIWREIPKRKIN